MAMVTKCPSCATTFRVTPQQLQAQHGMVRCGRCASVFDGFKTLATLPEVAQSDPAPEPFAERSSPDFGEIPTRPAVVEMSNEEPPQPVETAAQQTPTLAPEPPPVVPSEAHQAERLPRKRSSGWAFGVLLLVLALAAQGVYFYRSEIAANLPEARPYLNRICDQLRCTVMLPQRPRSISIEASDMQATDPANSGLIALTATLRNHATVALGYPALDVVLTNTREHTVARRIFLPAEYLGAGRDARSGIPPNAEITVRLDIDSGNLGAAGFRLDLLAAPSR